MKLTDMSFKGLGRYEEGTATFTCLKRDLPAPWDYVYTNGDVLLRIRHDGGGYLQVGPPGGPALFRPERGETAPMIFAWLAPEEGRAFSNFATPTVPLEKPGTEPDDYSCTFAPDAATYRLVKDGWEAVTEVMVPAEGVAMAMTVTVTNRARKARRIALMPVLKPHLAPFSLAPWDVPANYQTSAFFGLGKRSAIWMETREPSGDSSKRLRAAVVTDLAPTSFEVSQEDFAGNGSWQSPDAVWSGKLARNAAKCRKFGYGKTRTANSVIGQLPMAGFSKTVTLRPGKSASFTVVFGKLPDSADGSLPPRSSVTALAKLLDPKFRARARKQVMKRYEDMFALRSLKTPDAALNRYTNEWLPLQLDWVNLLDRGWPTGLRGSRDAAQDVTGSVPLTPDLAKRRLGELFSVQRSDGWFVRQYSTDGPDGDHDLRDYVDAGCWIWECLWEYVCYTRDMAVLKKSFRWLDTKKRSTVLEHVERLFDYYLARKNLGEHGLCKIREGDWNDSVNRAGVEGRGESVMVSCQVVLALEQAAELFESLGGGSKKKAARFRRGAAAFRKSLLRHALNREGYLNGVFTDGGRWAFSPKDADGRRRVNGPVNSFAITSGVAGGRRRAPVMKALNGLKGPHGWRLFYPAIGVPPIENLGRIGSGDLVPGLSENGSPYNHGCHGFLGRAAWTAGRGQMLYDVTRYLLPYDQKAHPILVQKTSPYGVVNHWKEAPGLDGHGGDTFLSGSISTCMRNIYQGLAGFRPGLEELVIDPVIPARWRGLEAEVPFMGGRYRIVVKNPSRIECGVASCTIDGTAAPVRRSGLLERMVASIPICKLRKGADCEIVVTLGDK